MARPVFIIDGSRTPFLKARSGPGPFTPVDLAVQCGRPLLARQPFAPDAFDQVILGCVNVIADEMNPARVAALRLGMGEAMVAFTVQINCGSGMQSIDTAYRYIREGVSDLILAGGSEALSYAPLVWPQQGVRWFAGLAGAKGFLGKLAAIAKARLTSKKDQMTKVATARAMMLGTKMALTRSASCCMGAREDCACSTRRRIWPRRLSAPMAVARYSSAPS